MIYTWTPATGNDISDIINLANQHFKMEIDSIFNIDTVAETRNATYAVINQFYNPCSELLSVARDDNNRLIAYTWAKADEVTAWSDEHMVVIRMAHVALDLSARQRIRLINDMLSIWEQFAHLARNPVICSTTMRSSQDAYLKLHARAGYLIHGSYAYKRINLK
jgi:hypothetical protein